MQINNQKEYLVWVLFPLALFYWGMIFWRNVFYKYGFFVTRKLPAPVISIGNITVGGTGKTPMVIALANTLQNEGYRPAIISRGYGRTSTGPVEVNNTLSWNDIGDEPAIMAKQTKNIPIIVDENRFRGGMILYQKYKPNIFLLDDGFQHRSIYRDLDIVLINSKDSSRDHKLLPYGLLREPWDQMKRADIVISSKNNISKMSPYLKRRLGALKKPLLFSRLKFGQHLISITHQEENISNMHHKSAFLFSGLGDNQSFIKSVESIGLTIIDQFLFSDHHQYDKQDFTLIESRFNKSGADYILTTEKDMIKLGELWNQLPIFYLPAETTIPKGLNLKSLLSD